MAKKKTELSDKKELEELESYCNDEFYYDIYEDLIDGDLFKPLDFFRLLDSQVEFVETNKARPLFVGRQLAKLPYNNRQLDYLFRHLTDYFANEDDDQIGICCREISRVWENLETETETPKPKPEIKYSFKAVLEHLETLPIHKDKIAFLIEQKTTYEQNRSWTTIDFDFGEATNFSEKCELEIKKLINLRRLEAAPKIPIGDIKKHKDLSLDRATLFFNYLFNYAKANCHNTKKAEVISFLTPFSANTVGDKLSNLHSKADHNFMNYEKDMLIVRKYFENLGLSEVVEMINRDLEIEN